jgi:hypothetical protein
LRYGEKGQGVELRVHLSDKWGAHSSTLFGMELALGQGHTLRGSAEKLGAWSMNHPKMSEVAGWLL